MAYALNFSHYIRPNYAQRCCKRLQHPQVRKFKALLQGQECVSFVVQVHSRYCSSEDTKHIQLIRTEFENFHKHLKAIDNLWNEAMKEGKLDLDKVIGERLSFEADASHYGNRYFSNEMMKVFQSSAEADKVIEIGKIFDDLQKKWFPCYPMIDHPRRRTIIHSIQKRILELDAVITANIRPLPSLDWTDIYERWEKIFQETDNPRVKRLIAVLEDAGIQEFYFHITVKLLFLEPAPTNKNYDDVPPLTEFEPDGIKFAVLPIFDPDFYQEYSRWMVEDLDGFTAVKCVTHVLMKPLSEFSS